MSVTPLFLIGDAKSPFNDRTKWKILKQRYDLKNMFFYVHLDYLIQNNGNKIYGVCRVPTDIEVEKVLPFELLSFAKFVIILLNVIHGKEDSRASGVGVVLLGANNQCRTVEITSIEELNRWIEELHVRAEGTGPIDLRNVSELRALTAHCEKF